MKIWSYNFGHVILWIRMEINPAPLSITWTFKQTHSAISSYLSDKKHLAIVGFINEMAVSQSWAVSHKMHKNGDATTSREERQHTTKNWQTFVKKSTIATYTNRQLF